VGNDQVLTKRQSWWLDELYKKSLKGYFKLQKDFLPLSPKPKTSIHIFDHTIKPIALYGKPFAVENNRIISSGYIRQWIGLSCNSTRSGQFLV
jgi:hypothetical protein